MSFSGSRDSRRSSSARRRQARATRIFLLVGSLFALASFFGGYAWQSKKSKLRTTTSVERAPADPAARAEALDHIDEAIRAKHEKRTAGALSALERARSADPSVPGVDIAFAEIALEQGEFTQMRAAAAAAKKKKDHAAGASFLLGMDAWINRGASDSEMSSAADAAVAHFREATDYDLFDATACFFWGDVMRFAGREAEGNYRAVGALHRFNPWDSSDILAAKVLFASAEGNETVIGGLAFLPDSSWTRLVGEFAAARRAGVPASLDALSGLGAARSLKFLSGDPSARVAPGTPLRMEVPRGKSVAK